MLYISLVDIYGKAIDGFSQVHNEDNAFIYATLSFFCGAILMLFLDKCVYWLLQWERNRASGSGEQLVAGIIAGDAENPGEELDQMREKFQKKVENEEGEEGEEKSKVEGEDADEENVEQPKSEDTEDSSTDSTDKNESQQLRHMGFAMALAIAIHNFPEGMVTYLAYVEDPAVGIALAIGIAVHNIPGMKSLI